MKMTNKDKKPFKEMNIKEKSVYIAATIFKFIILGLCITMLIINIINSFKNNDKNSAYANYSNNNTKINNEESHFEPNYNSGFSQFWLELPTGQTKFNLYSWYNKKTGKNQTSGEYYFAEIRYNPEESMYFSNYNVIRYVFTAHPDYGENQPSDEQWCLKRQIGANKTIVCFYKDGIISYPINGTYIYIYPLVQQVSINSEYLNDDLNFIYGLTLLCKPAYMLEYGEKQYNDGFNIGYWQGIEIGKTEGQQQGYEQGYNEGFEAGKLSCGENSNLSAIFMLEPIAKFFGTPLFGNFSIGDMLSVIIFVSIALIFIKLFAGG